jgi:hypothetical protein
MEQRQRDLRRHQLLVFRMDVAFQPALIRRLRIGNKAPVRLIDSEVIERVERLRAELPSRDTAIQETEHRSPSTTNLPNP